MTRLIGLFLLTVSLASTSTGQLLKNAWNYLVFTYDGATERLYLNGSLDSSLTASASSLCQAAVPVKFGMETSVFAGFSGTLDDVRIYNQSLSSAAVSGLYRSF